LDTDDPHIEPASPGTKPKSNVVRLPRDWLGPREELVPVGADRPQRESRAEHERDLPGGPSGNLVKPDGELIPFAPDPPVDEPNEHFAPSADDFWGEHSASVQDAVQRPTRPRAEPVRAREGTEPVRARPGAAADAISAEARARADRGRILVLPARRLGLLTAAALALVALGGVLLSRGPTPPSSRHRPDALTTSAAVGTLTSALTHAERQIELAGTAPARNRTVRTIRRPRRVAMTARHAKHAAPVLASGGGAARAGSGSVVSAPPSGGSGSASGSSASRAGAGGSSLSESGSEGTRTPAPTNSPSPGGPTGSAPFGPGTPG
jgi:hypothetical protein